MTETLPPHALPFAAFLAILRDKGFDIGVREYLLLARLLERWPGTDLTEFGDSLAALLARTEVESQEIRRLFSETYAPAPPAGRDDAAPAPAPDRWHRFRTHAWLIAVVAAVTLLALALRVPEPQPPPRPPSTTVPRDAPPTPTAPATPVRAAAPSPPPLPAPPAFVERRIVVLAGGGLFLLAFAGAWALKLREARHRWARDAWASALAAIPGPFHFPIVLRDPIARVPRIDIEDTATILGRAFTASGQRQQLDVRRTLVRTLQNGRLPHFVFRPRRAMRTILVLHDVAPEMRMWRAKIDRFLVDLERQGVPLERCYFDGDIRRLSKTAHRASVTLDSLLRLRRDAAILVISSGSQLGALLEQDTGWVSMVAEREWHAWLTPVTDTRLWPAEFDQLPFAVWPMTRQGLLQAARALVEPNAVSAADVRVRARAEWRVTLDGVERIKRLASLVPHPTTDLLDALRRQFAPDVSDAAVLQLLRGTATAAAPVVRLPDEEMARCLTAMRFESPRLEAEVRRFLLGVLRDSEPAIGSAAHLRWEIAAALQRSALADLGDGDRHSAAEALARYANGPMWEEVRHLTRLLPATPPRERGAQDNRPGAAPLAHQRGGGTPPSAAPAAAGAMRWIWPGGRELLPAAIAAAVVILAFWFSGILPARVLAHVANAYGLAYTPPSATTTYGSLELTLPGSAAASLPDVVDLYKGETVYRTAISLTGRRATVPIADSADLGYHYQMRARLPRGNLALSDWAWVPGREVPVLIDARPWARVTMTGTHVPAQAQTTPFLALLEPGRYMVHLENGDVTPSMDREITVNEPAATGTSAAQTFQFSMPGFNPDQTAQTLLAP